MTSYRLTYKKGVIKDLCKIPKKDLTRIYQKIETLKQDPRSENCEKLVGSDKYRIRQGNYRILYTVNDKTVTVLVIKVGHRKSIYR